MKLASLKQTYSELGEKPVGAETDEYYPSLYFNEKQLAAMDMDRARVGDELSMLATVRVSSVNESKNGARSVSFEILEAGMKPKEKDKDAASVLFPNG